MFFHSLFCSRNTHIHFTRCVYKYCYLQPIQWPTINTLALTITHIKHNKNSNKIFWIQIHLWSKNYEPIFSCNKMFPNKQQFYSHHCIWLQIYWWRRRIIILPKPTYLSQKKKTLENPSIKLNVLITNNAEKFNSIFIIAIT